MAVFDIQRSTIQKIEVGFKFPSEKASVHLGDEFYLAGGSYGRHESTVSISNLWKIRHTGEAA